MKKSTPVRRQIKPDKNRVKNKPRTDPFERALNLARRKYERAEEELTKAREKIEALEENLPGLASVIAGLEDYFGMEPTFTEHQLSQPRFSVGDLAAVRDNVKFEKGIDREYETESIPEKEQEVRNPPNPQKKRGRPPKPGQAQLYICNKCGGFVATAEFPPICTDGKCMSRDLTLKEVKGPERAHPGGAGGMVLDVGLPPSGDDDKLLPGNLPGRELLP